MKLQVRSLGVFCLAVYCLSALHSWIPHNHHQHGVLASHVETEHHTAGHSHDHAHNNHNKESNDKKDFIAIVLSLLHEHSHSPELEFEQENFHKRGETVGNYIPLAIETDQLSSLCKSFEIDAFAPRDFFFLKLHFPDDPLPGKNGLRAPPFSG
ncbi:MAG: hypothetical protein ACPGLV_13370 [Bacteroidia bacterium]